MSEWWTYRPSDFLLFSPQTYYRLFELYNIDIWPMQVVSLALCTAIITLAVRNPAWQGRAISAILASCWLWVAAAYLLQHYSTINWAARYFAIGFTIEAILLIWYGIIRDRLLFRSVEPACQRAGIGVFLFALVFQPFIAPLVGREWIQAEIFGVAPDPTVTATLGLLLLADNKPHWLLMIIPFIWCTISGVTLWTMKSPDFFITPLAALLVLGLAAWKVFMLPKQYSEK
ncbi:MAG: hypothetical protein AMJ53_07690 [Gammaproteobacteria bacterium SG8_11]|nr:MAG: hypothetical protein AMJ53_07690 [Gammaproteobacteria bacterium SG8_11]